MNTTVFQIMFQAAALMYPDVKVTIRQPLAQAVLESGNFTSHNWDVNNNCFGMRPPQARETTATNKGSQDAYAHYDSPWDCIRDYFEFCRGLGLLNDAKLDTYIKTKYAKDPNYYTKVQANIKALAAAGKYINPAKILGLGVVAGTGASVAAVWAISEILEEVV